MYSNSKVLKVFVASMLLVISGATLAGKPTDKGKPPKGDGGGGGGLSSVSKKNWDETHVRRVLRAFAYGGHATESQINTWAGMHGSDAVAEILTFDFNNERLSPTEDATADYCHSLVALQDFWGSDDPDNPLRWDDRIRYSHLYTGTDLRDENYQRTYTLAVSTRGCNPFLYKMAFYLSNYHGSIHERNAGDALIRDYFDDYMAVLNSGADFVEVLTAGASHAAVARAYRHDRNYVRYNGDFIGNEDFAREYLQLFFGILGTTIDSDYYETTMIKNNARVLTGMAVDQDPDNFGSDDGGDWYLSPINFTDHVDLRGNSKRNLSNHNAGCVEVLYTDICGATAAEKLQALGPVAAAHEESMQNTPVKIIGFFADDNLDEDKIAQIRVAWEDSNNNLLAFLQAYASSTAFHNESTFKYFTTFDRNLNIQNANFLTNEGIFTTKYWLNAHDRMRRQGMEIFRPIRNVFGHQTGVDALNNPFIFRDAFYSNAIFPGALSGVRLSYTLSDGGPTQEWVKDWGAVVPTDKKGRYLVDDVADWLWNRFIGDDGKNFDTIARAQVQALLAEGVDFALSVDPGNTDPDTFYTSADISGGDPAAASKNQDNANTQMDLSTDEGNLRIGLAVNFISMTPYSFAMEGK
jgi:hypothetical protein